MAFQEKYIHNVHLPIQSQAECQYPVGSNSFLQTTKDDEQIRKALEDIGLDPDDKRTYRKYSLGMKQKLGIAAAVMENPDIIILDEPINALDDVSVEKVHDILEEQKKRGAVIIIACHDKEELDQLSDEIIEISDGRIINKTC